MSSVAIVSDQHLEEEGNDREETLWKVSKYLGNVDNAIVPGDVGREEDWEALDRMLDDRDIDYTWTMGNMDSREGHEYFVDRNTVDVDEDEDPKHTEVSGVKTDDVTDFVNNIKLMEDDFSGNDYNWLISHNPKHVGIDPWSQEFIPDEENGRGRRTADHEFYDIILTGHYHKGGAYVNENGSLVVTNPSVSENYKEGAPTRSMHLAEFEGDYIKIQEKDLDAEDDDTVYEKHFRYDGEDFEEVDPSVSNNS